MGKFTLREAARTSKTRATDVSDAEGIAKLLDFASNSSDCCDFELLDENNRAVKLERYGRDGHSYWRVRSA